MGLQVTDPTLLCLPKGVIFCDHINIINPAESELQTQPAGGRTAMHDKEVGQLEQSEMDSDESLSDFIFQGAKPQRTHTMWNLNCPVCLLTATNVGQLQDHLHHFHSDQKLYSCGH